MAELAIRLARHGAEDAAAAVRNETIARSARLLAGLDAYLAHPYHRDLEDPPTLIREGVTRILDFGPADGRPVLIVPSLINRAYILDLAPESSLCRWLTGRGIRPLLVDWGTPGAAELAADLTEVVAGRLTRLVDGLTADLGRGVALVGYCMGGLLATALALLRPAAIERLALLATPWDFHSDGGVAAGRLLGLQPFWGSQIAALGRLETDTLQALFMAVDPGSALRKFSAFTDLAPDGEKARAFVALEDWLNDGVPLAGPVASECLADWYGDNGPARGTWRVGGHQVAPERIGCPALAVIPARDRIVPPASAEALAAALPRCRRMTPPLGHIGLVASRRAPRILWPDLAAWLLPA